MYKRNSPFIKMQFSENQIVDNWIINSLEHIKNTFQMKILNM